MFQELVHEEEYKGLVIKLFLLPEYEYEYPDWEMTEDEEKELYKKIRNGDLLWFIAKVESSIDGHVLATDYLGGCCYESVEDFINDDYYSDMKETVFENACKEIENLIKWSEDHASNQN